MSEDVKLREIKERTKALAEARSRIKDIMRKQDIR